MTSRLEIKADVTVSPSGEIEGIAWPFGSPDRVGDVITKGAFAGSATPIPMLFGHDQNDPVGVWTDATEGPDGLTVKGRLLIDDLPRAREVRALVMSGAVRGLSIGFTTKTATRRPKGGRTITALDLLECSLVAIPCHPGARVSSAKSALRALSLAEQLHRAAAHLSRRNHTQ